MKPKLLYVSGNDGSDMRVTKEVSSLSKVFDIYYLGIGVITEKSFCRSKCKEFILFDGTLRSPRSLLRLFIGIISARIKNKFSTVHVVDEQLFILMQPALLGLHVVLDIFDSLFLKINRPGESLFFLKCLFYTTPSKIIVTDENRMSLLPKRFKNKSHIIPNVPLFDLEVYETTKTKSKKIRLALFGSIAENRGAKFVQNLLELSEDYICYAAGWCADEFSKNLMQHQRVNYLGVISQREANKFVAENADFVICIYPVNNINNIYASPNKIYDCYQNRTPVIINNKVLVSSFVQERGIGLVVDLDEPISTIAKKISCFAESNNTNYTQTLAMANSWDVHEVNLIKLHSK